MDNWPPSNHNMKFGWCIVVLLIVLHFKLSRTICTCNEVNVRSKISLDLWKLNKLLEKTILNECQSHTNKLQQFSNPSAIKRIKLTKYHNFDPVICYSLMCPLQDLFKVLLKSKANKLSGVHTAIKKNTRIFIEHLLLLNRINQFKKGRKMKARKRIEQDKFNEKISNLKSEITFSRRLSPSSQWVLPFINPIKKILENGVYNIPLDRGKPTNVSYVPKIPIPGKVIMNYGPKIIKKIASSILTHPEKVANQGQTKSGTGLSDLVDGILTLIPSKAKTNLNQQKLNPTVGPYDKLRTALQSSIQQLEEILNINALEETSQLRSGDTTSKVKLVNDTNIDT